jgi:hypothetical protein
MHFDDHSGTVPRRNDVSGVCAIAPQCEVKDAMDEPGIESSITSFIAALERSHPAWGLRVLLDLDRSVGKARRDVPALLKPLVGHSRPDHEPSSRPRACSDIAEPGHGW